VEKIQKVVNAVDFPKNYFYRFGENYQQMVDNQKQLTLAVGLMLFLVFLVLASLFASYTKPFIIMASVPLALIGSTLALKLCAKAVNISVLMGLMILGGIVVNNAIVLIDHISHLQKQDISFLRAVIQGSSDRLRPILITSLTTILGMLPLAIDRSEDAALWSPLAITVIGGMTVSTFLTLFAVPCLYILLNDFNQIAADWKNHKLDNPGHS
jgi:HAE1 family hydrophobic/amphiphilic exporter-1